MHIKINRKALIITFQHPFGATEMMAESIAAALRLNGYDASIAIMNSPTFVQDVGILSDPDLELVISAGSLPLNIIISGRGFIWQFIPKHVIFITLIVDSIPYDFRIPGFESFMDDYPKFNNLITVSFENNIAEILTKYSGKKVYYMPTGANLVPFIKEQPQYPDRLMFWGSIGAELSRTDYTSDLFEVIRNNNPWKLSETGIKKVVDSIIASEDSYGLRGLSDALNMPIEHMLHNKWINELCAIDSAIKRFRRTFLIESLRDFPLDIYGKNWNKYLSSFTKIRLMQANPDHNLAFGYICQHYAGVVNIDPNWGNGTNERSITALSLGVRVATNKNKRIDNIVGCYQFNLTGESIRAACLDALNGNKPIPLLSECTWEYLIGKFLREVSIDLKGAGVSAT